jgi:hypothetical protein
VLLCYNIGELEAPTMSEQVQEVLLSNAPSLSAFCLNERVPDYNHSSEAAVDKHIAEQTLQAVAGGSKRGIKLVRVNDEVCISEVVEGSEIQISPTTHKLVRTNCYLYCTFVLFLTPSPHLDPTRLGNKAATCPCGQEAR